VPAGGKAPKGSTVTLFVSAGIPEVVFDNGRDVLIADGVTGKTLAAVAKGSQDEENGAFSSDGGSVAFTSSGQVFVRNLKKKDAVPVRLTSKPDHYTDLAWAPPAATVNVLALIKGENLDDPASAKTSLCFGRITDKGMKPRCKDPSPNLLGRKINWSPNGKTLLVFGATPDFNQFGMIRYRSRTPFSTNPDDWKSDGFQTDTTLPLQGALDAAISPDGKQVAEVFLGKKGPRLFLAKADDLLLQDAKPLGVVACKVTWRPDGQELLIVRSDDCIRSDTGDLLRVPVTGNTQRSLRLEGDNPAFQPISVE
jgi:hypothetical protein